MNRKDLLALTLAGPTGENPVLDPPSCATPQQRPYILKRVVTGLVFSEKGVLKKICFTIMFSACKITPILTTK